MDTVGVTREEPQLLIDRPGSIGHIRLNRSKALNSLTLEMVRGIEAALDAFEYDPDVAAVLVTGEGERGLCAGGDIRAIYASVRAGTNAAQTFWREEYFLNARISHFSKPYVVIMDGITMGGGVGISAHGSHRIVTERTRLAMPETGIGFFPDIGATWLLSRGEGEFGTFLGLSGEQIGATEIISAGLADFYVPRERLSGLVEALCAIDANASREQVSRTIERFKEPTQASPLEQHRALIDRAFAFDTVEEILVALQSDGCDFARRTVDALKAKSPTSLKVSLRLLRFGRASVSLDECLAREFAAIAAVLSSADFFEGIRAAVIDKDRNPQWSPPTLAAVGEASISRHFPPHEPLL